MGLFKDSIVRNADRMAGRVDSHIEMIAVELFTEVVKMSPTKPNAKTAKGEFINNWNAQRYGEVRAHTSARSMVGTSSLASIRTIRNGRTFYRRDSYVTLTNTSSYAANVEYDGWMAPKWSGTIGPYAPVRKAFTNVAPKYR